VAQFRKVYTLQGFDREAVPRWQMVPMTELLARRAALPNRALPCVGHTPAVCARRRGVVQSRSGRFDESFRR
jgi:hypothetical protein